jgi:SPP1 family predicted phage head-tail adaptor
MQSGKLRHPIAIEQKSSARDSMGAAQEVWSTFALPFAGFETLSGRELEAAQKINPEITSKITIRYQAGVIASMRVNFTDTTAGRNRIFDILAVMDPDERTRKMELLSVERYIAAAAAGPLVGFPNGWGRKAFIEAPDGVRTVFTLSGIPLPSVLQIYIGGIQQGTGHYTVNGASVTLDFAPKVDDEMVPWF